MRKGRLTMDVWGLDLTSEMREHEMGYGDSVWAYGYEGEECWTAESEDDWTYCLVPGNGKEPKDDQEILDGGFVVHRGYELVDYHIPAPTAQEIEKARRVLRAAGLL